MHNFLGLTSIQDKFAFRSSNYPDQASIGSLKVAPATMLSDKQTFRLIHRPPTSNNLWNVLPGSYGWLGSLLEIVTVSPTLTPVTGSSFPSVVGVLPISDANRSLIRSHKNKKLLRTPSLNPPPLNGPSAKALLSGRSAVIGIIYAKS